MSCGQRALWSAGHSHMSPSVSACVVVLMSRLCRRGLLGSVPGWLQSVLPAQSVLREIGDVS